MWPTQSCAIEARCLLLLQHLQVKRRRLHTIELRNLLQRRFQCGAAARLDRNHKGQTVFWVSRLLQQGIDINFLLREVARDSRHDARAVIDDKPDVVRYDEVAIYPCSGTGDGDGAAAMGNGQYIGDDGHRSRISSGPMAGKDRLASVLSTGDHHVFRSP